MNRWIRAALVVLILGLTFGAGWAVAQQQTPMVLSGNDVGFRVDRSRIQNGKLTGAWVVRINGQWVEPDTSGTRPLTTR